MKLTSWLVVSLILAVLTAGCSGSLAERRKIDYKSAGRLPPLEVPPDLVTPRVSERYNVPPGEGTTYSVYTQERQEALGGRDTAVLPVQEGMKVLGDGRFRWLRVDRKPDELWEPLRGFWQDAGFLIAYEIPEAGIMETDWAENRAKAPLGPVRRFIKSIFDSAYSLPERDKFRTRVEPSEDAGFSEIFIAHYGIYEVVTTSGRSNQTQFWQVRPSDAELEAEMLYRLMARLGASAAQVEQARLAPPPSPRAQLLTAENAKYLELRDQFDRAWNRVGLALDRVGFTVEDRDRAQGIYFVRYNDPDVNAKRSGLGRLAFWRDDEVAEQEYHIRVIGAGEGSEVRVQDSRGANLTSSTAARILAILQDELK